MGYLIKHMLLSISLIVCISLPARCQDTQSSCRTAKSVGREFIVGFLQPPQMESVNELHIAGASRSQSIIVITAPEVFQEPVRKDLSGSDQFAIVNLMSMSEFSSTAVLVQSSSDISVIGLVAGNNTGAFLALPVEALGTEYFVATYYIATRVLRVKRGNEFIVIGTATGTVVNITFRGNVRYKGTTHQSGSSHTITINRLEIARFISKTDDLTGTHVLSSQPVVVISGSKCADVPVDVRYCDHLVEQMPPFQFWGSHFVTTPLAERVGGDIFRVMAGRNGTTVRMCNEREVVIDAGEFIEQSVPSDVSCTITSSRPVLVLQYNKGASTDKSSADPSMTLVPALEQYFSEGLFATVDFSRGIAQVLSFLNIALQCELIPYIKHNMFPIDPALFKGTGSFNVSIAGRNMCSAQIQLDRLGHNFFQFEKVPAGRLAMTRYGNAISEIATSYSLPAGFAFNDNECFNLSDNFLTVPVGLTESPGIYSVSPYDHPQYDHTYEGINNNLVTASDGLHVSGDGQGANQSNMLAISLIIFIIFLIIVTLLAGYVIFLKKRIEQLEVEKRTYTSVPVAVGFDGYIVLDGSQIAHREYMTLNNSDEMWRLSRKSDKAVFRGIQPAHSMRSHSSMEASSQRRVGSIQPSINSQSERVFERENLDLMSLAPPVPSQHTNHADVFGNTNPAFNDAISIYSQQDSVSEIVSQPTSLRRPIRPVRRHHSHIEGFNTTKPVPKPRSHGPRVLRRSISTPGEHLFGGPMKAVYYHVPRGDPVHPYDRPRQRTCSEGLAPSAADILLPPEDDSKGCSRKSSSNESESSLLPPQQDDGYMSMKEARVSTISRGSHSEGSPSRESGGASYSYSHRNRKEPFDEDSTEYTELF